MNVMNQSTERVASDELFNDRSSTLYGDNASTLCEEEIRRAEFDRVACTLYLDDHAFETASTVYDGASVLDDNTLYDGASVRTGTASTLYDDDTSTLVGDNKKSKSKLNYITEEDLPNMRVRVQGLNIKNRGSKEVIYITLSVRRLLRRNYEDVINNRCRELWQIEKNYDDFSELDTILRESGHVRKEQSLFDKNLFLSHNPEKTAKRKAHIDQYFRIVFATLPMKDSSPLCQFLNSGIVVNQKSFGSTIKEGYLTRKEGMFKTWKTRYCVIKGTTFQVYETRAGGSPIDSVPLQRAMVATLNFNNAFHPLQHGFSIMQFKKDRPGLPLYIHHEYWPTSHDEDKEREDWQIKIMAAVRVIETQEGSVTRAKEDIKEETRLKDKQEYQALRKKQAFEAKQQQTKKVDNNNNNSSLLKKLSEKK